MAIDWKDWQLIDQKGYGWNRRAIFLFNDIFVWILQGRERFCTFPQLYLTTIQKNEYKIVGLGRPPDWEWVASAAGKGRCQKRFSGFCLLRGYPPPYTLNGKSFCQKTLSGQGGYPPSLNGKNPLKHFWQVPLPLPCGQYMAIFHP